MNSFVKISKTTVNYNYYECMNIIDLILIASLIILFNHKCKRKILIILSWAIRNNFRQYRNIKEHNLEKKY
jgi:hypothetical protein